VIEIEKIPVTSFSQNDTIRLISTAYIDEPAMAPLVDDEAELDFLADLEGLTSASRGVDIILPSGMYSEELLTSKHGYGWTHVNAAFCYTRPTGNRFNGPDRGAWYATWGEASIETAHAEVSWHLTRELEAVGVYENITSYREIYASFAADMHDLSSFDGDDIFHSDPDIGYPAGQSLSTALRGSDANGILYPSVRQKSGNCLAAFRPNMVQNIRQGDTWTFKWDGDPAPNISKG